MTARGRLATIALLLGGLQVDIYATRDRLGWAPRADQWMLFHDAALR